MQISHLIQQLLSSHEFEVLFAVNVVEAAGEMIASFISHTSNSKVIGQNLSGISFDWLNIPHKGLKLTTLEVPIRMLGISAACAVAIAAASAPVASKTAVESHLLPKPWISLLSRTAPAVNEFTNSE